MGGFDIASLRGRTSFTANLQKRKALGLDSDSEDDMPYKKKINNRKNSATTNTTAAITDTKATINLDDDIPSNNSNSCSSTQPKEEKKPVVELDPFEKELQETLSTTEQYLAAAEALMAEPMPRASSHHPRRSHSNHSGNDSSEPNSSSFIELSNNEEEEEYIPIIPEAEIPDLDPSLQEFLKESSESNKKQHPAQKVQIKLQYNHNLPSTSEKVKDLLVKLMKPMKIIIMDTEQFQKVLDAFASHKKLKRDELVLTYNDNYVYPQTTPAGIGMSDIGINYMNVYPRSSYEKMKEEKERERQERLRRYTQQDTEVKQETLKIKGSASSTNTSAATDSTATNNEESEQGSRIVLKLRGKYNKDVPMRARYTTTLESLLKHYKEITGNTGGLKLSLDGEILDLSQTVQDVDLEDEDMIEVV